MVAPLIQPGEVVGGRYVIRRAVATSATHALYEAEDTSLKRTVAIRFLLADALASEEWREYVRHCTTAVAALLHPHLVRLYDSGEHAGTLYVVTEWLAGGSLADALAARGRLAVEQTTMIGLEAASALDYAHARGFVHGSLQPSKILFDDEGRVRVNDLGLTAALQAGVVSRSLEEARYTSPEQVIGQPAEPRSDVYSLSLILFRCLTGHAAHDGRTLETIRSNRLGAPLPHRPELGALDLILAMGAAPDAAARPDAALFASRLTAVAATLPVPRPVAAPPSREATFTAPTADAVLSAPAGPVRGRTSENPAVDVVRPLDLPGYRESVETARRNSAPRPRRRPPWRAVALLCAIVVILGGVAAGVAYKEGLFSSSHLEPSLKGLTLAEAHTKVGPLGFTVDERHTRHSAKYAFGEIVGQSPLAGTSLKSGSTIYVVVSLGRRTVTVPAVLGDTCTQATTALENLGLTATCPKSAEMPSATYAAGQVAAYVYALDTDPAAVPGGSQIVLRVSTGSPDSTTTSTTTTTSPDGPRPVPNIIGDDRAQAISAMAAAGLYFVTEGPGASTETWTKVVSTNPPVGTEVAWHSSVTVTVTDQ